MQVNIAARQYKDQQGYMGVKLEMPANHFDIVDAFQLETYEGALQLRKKF